MYRILLADDSKLTLAVEKAYLESQNLRVFTTTTASEVLPLARDLQPDIVIIDYEMPEMKGDEVCLSLGSEEATAHVPVLVLSALDDPEIRLRCEAAGAIGFAQKSDGREALMDRVAEILGMARRRHVRVPCHLTVGVVAAGISYWATLHNLSVSGIYMTATEAFHGGKPLLLKFQLPETDEELAILGEIMRVETLGTSLYGYGMQFLEPDKRTQETLCDYVSRVQ